VHVPRVPVNAHAPNPACCQGARSKGDKWGRALHATRAANKGLLSAASCVLHPSRTILRRARPGSIGKLTRQVAAATCRRRAPLLIPLSARCAARRHHRGDEHTPVRARRDSPRHVVAVLALADVVHHAILIVPVVHAPRSSVCVVNRPKETFLRSDSK
jgi:hypothetical protein